MSHLPGPQSEDVLRASLHRHDPQHLRDRTGAVLLDVEVDARGTVLDVDVVTPPATAAHPMHRAVISDGERNVRRAPWSSGTIPRSARPRRRRFGKRAITPAVRARDHRAVPFRWRMTLVFDHSLAS